MSIRVAGTEDARQIIRLLQDIVAENEWVRTQLPFDTEARVRNLRERIRAGNAIVFVAENNGTIVGQLALFLSGTTADLGMFVHKDARGRGIGRRMLDAAHAWAKEAGLMDFVLEVYTHNTRARAIYSAYGFVESGPRYEERRNDGRVFEVIPMRKALC